MKTALLIFVTLCLLGCEKRVVSESSWGYDMFPEYQNLPRGDSRVDETRKAERKIEHDAENFWDKLTPWN